VIDQWLEKAGIDDVISPAFAADLSAKFAAKAQRIAELQDEIAQHDLWRKGFAYPRIAELEEALAERTQDWNALHHAIKDCNDELGKIEQQIPALLAAERKAGAEEAHDHMTLRDIQEDQKPWVAHNFGRRATYMPLLGAMEELGELAHAHLKAEQGIRGTVAEHEVAAKDAVADIIIFLLDYCSARGWDAASIVSDTWKAVRTRDFKADPIRGIAGTSSAAQIESGEVEPDFADPRSGADLARTFDAIAKPDTSLVEPDESCYFGGETKP
jgi:NTP pyrophosphatase (non-canonical NTP hydrolase)